MTWESTPSRPETAFLIPSVFDSQRVRFTVSRLYTRSAMNSTVGGGGTGNTVFGILFHAGIALLGGFALGSVIALGTEALSRGESTNVQALMEFVPFIVSSALLALFVTPRWFGGSAPWVGLLGLAPLFMGWQELWRGWSPTWSVQTRSEYLLSQLFGVRGGCGDSECLYVLFFTVPCACLMAYSVAALVAIRFIPRRVM